MNRLLALAMALSLAGCAAVPKGAQRPPASWQHPLPASGCGNIDGRFAEVGIPAPQNARAGLAHSAWPTMGALSAMVRSGANGMPSRRLAAVSIEIVDGHPRFKGYAADGAEIPLQVREWWCEGGSLTTRAILGAVDSQAVPETRDESVLRLWKAADGALIAEQTLVNITPGMFGSSSRRQPLTRSYFSFPAATSSST